ncbi:MAG TPA: DUF5694 domain-containing protein [Rhodanobacteraceae bacterium]|nr:DUF5694 domain-containing protein [Rhodanobacteraceae bacterium]
MFTLLRFPLAFAAAILTLGALPAAAAPPVEVMIVGTFHMDNPGHDLHNMKVDDVLTGKRQKELADVAAGLLRFKPTVVMVESQRRDDGAATLPRYRQYLAGTLEPSRNEVVQVGFRLAKAAGLKEAYGIDVDGDFPYEDVQKFADAHGQAAILKQEGDKIDVSLKEASDLLAASSIGATLRWFNQPERIALDHGFYQDMLQIGRLDEQPGAALVAAWNKRNFEICARMIQVVKPGDRAVVLYGSGHAFLLRQCVAETPGFRLVEPNAYLPAR